MGSLALACEARQIEVSAKRVTAAGALPVVTGDCRDVATVSANWDETIGNIIAEPDFADP